VNGALVGPLAGDAVVGATVDPPAAADVDARGCIVERGGAEVTRSVPVVAGTDVALIYNKLFKMSC